MSEPRASCPLAGPLASSAGAPNPHNGAALRRITQMTLYSFPFFHSSSLSSPAAFPTACPSSSSPCHGGGV